MESQSKSQTYFHFSDEVLKSPFFCLLQGDCSLAMISGDVVIPVLCICRNYVFACVYRAFKYIALALANKIRIGDIRLSARPSLGSPSLGVWAREYIAGSLQGGIC